MDNNIKRYHSSVIGTANNNDQAGQYPLSFVCWNSINFVANDSDSNAMYINFDQPVGGVGTIRLNAGETIDDLRINCKQLFVQGIGDDVPFRAIGS